MHIFFVNKRYPHEGVAGPAFTTQFLAEQLVKDGDRATVFCRTRRPEVIKEVMGGVNVIRAGLDLPFQKVFQILADALDAAQPDILHQMLPMEFEITKLPTMATERRLPIVQTLLAYNFLCVRGEMMQGTTICKTQCPDCLAGTGDGRTFAHHVCAVVAISRYMLDLHQRMGMFRTAPIQRVIHDAYMPPTEKKPSPRPGVTLRIGFLGRIHPSKGIHLLLQALTNLPRTRDWSLILGGRGDPNFEALLNKQFADSRVRFLGHVKPGDLLSQIDVLVVPSQFEEPLGRVALEAYAHGVPVIGARRGGIPEAIEPGRTGLIFDPDKPGDLASALTTLLDNPALVEQMKRPAREKWESEFTPVAITNQYRETYTAAIAARRGDS